MAHPPPLPVHTEQLLLLALLVAAPSVRRTVWNTLTPELLQTQAARAVFWVVWRWVKRSGGRLPDLFTVTSSPHLRPTARELLRGPTLMRSDVFRQATNATMMDVSHWISELQEWTNEHGQRNR